VGEIGQIYQQTIHTLGYLPERLPGDARADERYSELRRTAGEGFTPLQPLQGWIDVLGSDIDPTDVKLLGINGGRIAAAEYRMALALGARVAVLQGSGREAAKLEPDSEWGMAENLISLPADGMTVRAFIGCGVSALPGRQRETIAREIHEEYRRGQLAQMPSSTPSMADWGELREDLKESNRQQADDIFNKLREIDCHVAEVRDREPALATFTEGEVEKMAALEHARWNVERLLSGWTWGPQKDVGRKISPYLVGWDELPEQVKEWDRQAVRAIPRLLARIGLEVRR
jgi:hypothetical protein